MATNYRLPVLEHFAWQPPVLSVLLDTPPVSPARGDRYIVGTSPSGAWSGHANEIVYCSNATGPVWSFDIPSAGWIAWSVADARYYFFNGTAWSPLDVQGYSGYSGISGFSGYSGVGTSGYSGYSGDSGVSGYSGFSGEKGDSGYSGFSGFSGESGYSGESGTSGYSGYSGESGTSGYSGFSGQSGFSGPGATYDSDYECLIISA